MRAKSREIWQVTKVTFNRWLDINPFMLSAALSYYAIFSLPALLVTVIAISGFLFGKEAVNGEIYSQVKEFIGPEGAKQVQEMVKNAGKSQNSFLAGVISIITIIISATALFIQMQASLNLIWGVTVKPGRAIWTYLRDRMFSFGMVASLAFLLLISLVISSLLAALSGYIEKHLSYVSNIVLYLMDVCISLGIYVVLFALIYKILPDVKIRWKEVWIGSFATAVLFDIGKFLIGFYLGKSDPGSTYGAAGSIILVLLWVSYSSLILFLGAVFTKVYAETYGRELEPADYAIRIAIPVDPAKAVKA